MPRRATVLVVEDDADLRRLYRSALTIAGFAVLDVEDGVDALRLIDGGRIPDVVVLDLALPRLHGHDLHREIMSHTHTEHIPTVVVTGTAADDLDPNDFDCILRKPIDAEQLVAAVRRCLGTRD